MAKAIKATVKLQIPGAQQLQLLQLVHLGQHQVNIMEFCKQFNAQRQVVKVKRFLLLLLFIQIKHLVLL